MPVDGGPTTRQFTSGSRVEKEQKEEETARSLSGPRARQPRGQEGGGDHAGWIGNVSACDVECGSMVDRCPDDWQAERDVDRLAECEQLDRKSTRLNSSHSQISYAVFCLK